MMAAVGEERAWWPGEEGPHPDCWAPADSAREVGSHLVGSERLYDVTPFGHSRGISWPQAGQRIFPG